MLRRFLVALLAVAAPVLGSAPAAAKLKTIYSFCQVNKKCSDGSHPGAMLTDPSGNIFGVALDGGAHTGSGTIYELVHGGRYKRLYKFCLKQPCLDGDTPTDLLLDVSGNLYGITNRGGAGEYGTVFKLSPNPSGGDWILTKLYDFCAAGGHCNDGRSPAGLVYIGRDRGALYDGVSPLYGTTWDSGIDSNGTIFKLVPPAAGQGWTKTEIYHLCRTGCSSSEQAFAPPIIDASGNIFIHTSGGAHHRGVIYELSAAGTFSTVYDFCPLENCADGAYPETLIEDGAGTLYGTTEQGGQVCQDRNEPDRTCGTVFKLTGDGTHWTETVLHVFCSEPDCRDGSWPTDLLLDPSGALIGSTENGGGNDIDYWREGGGVIFKLQGTSYQVLHAFCAQEHCADGERPAPMTFDRSGKIVGLSGHIGHEGGIVFRLAY